MIDQANHRSRSDPLAACTSPASFWTPNLVVPESAWLEHAPFAFWLVEALRPKLIVELGTYSGFSFFAFCQAVQSLNLDTRAYGIDHWKGDEHTGFYGEEVFTAVNTHNELHYGSFARLVRSDFQQAVTHFDEHSIDLLHIDGTHTYEAVKSDYDQWRPRLADGGIVLFHDTNVREREFGVWRLWQELIEAHKHFSFLHGHGLGVLGIGDRFTDTLQTLFSYAVNSEATQIRLAYSRLGLALRDRITQESLATRLRKVEAEAFELARQSRRQNYLSTVISERNAEIERLHSELARVLQRDAAQTAEHGAEIDRLHSEVDQLREEARRIYNERDSEIKRLKHSFSWRITAPLREVARFLGRIRNARSKHLAA